MLLVRSLLVDLFNKAFYIQLRLDYSTATITALAYIKAIYYFHCGEQGRRKRGKGQIYAVEKGKVQVGKYRSIRLDLLLKSYR